MKKLYYLSRSTIPSSKANSVHVMNMCHAFSLLDLDVTLFAQKGINGGSSPYLKYGVGNNFKIKYLSFPLDYLFSLRMKLAISSIVSFFYAFFNKPNYIYGRDLLSCLFCSIFINSSTVTIELHKPTSEMNSILRWLLKVCCRTRKNLRFVVISDALKKLCVNDEVIPHAKIKVFHDGAPDPRGIVIEQMTLKGVNNINVGYTGHLYKGRGVDIILELACRNRNIDFHFIGGEKKDIDYWKSRIKTDNIFFYGHQERAIIPSYLNSFDILVAPYQNKVEVAGGGGDTSAYMSPLKIFEYMSARKPIICSNMPVLLEVLNESNSFLVPPSDVDAWCRALNKAATEVVSSEYLADTAFNDLISYYTWEYRAENILKFIRY